MSVCECVCVCVCVKKCWKNYIRHWVNTPTLDSCAGYSPIAFTSYIARVMEKILNGRIFDYLKKKSSLIYKHQSGFQRNHSTVTRLCFLAHFLAQHMAMDEGANIQSVFLDLSKAYARVSISGLLSKLSLIGFDYPSLERLTFYSTESNVYACRALRLPSRPHSQEYLRAQFSDQCFSWSLSMTSLNWFRIKLHSLLTTRPFTLLTSRWFQVVSALAVILTEQPIGLTGGVCSSVPQRASISPLDVRHSGVICVHERGPTLSRRFRHTSTLGLFLTAHLHGMTIFRTFTLHVLGS